MGRAVEWVWWWILGNPTPVEKKVLKVQGVSGCGSHVQGQSVPPLRWGGPEWDQAHLGKKREAHGAEPGGCCGARKWARLAARLAIEQPSRPLAAWRRCRRRGEARAGKSRQRHSCHQGMRTAVRSIKMTAPTLPAAEGGIWKLGRCWGGALVPASWGAPSRAAVSLSPRCT